MDGIHLHVSALDFAVFAAYLVIAMFLARLLAAKFADRPIGQAIGSLL